MSKQQQASKRLKDFISPAFSQLQMKVPSEKLDEITDLVGSSMAGAGRYFHNPEHVIHVGSGGDAVSAVAAFFHDLVYFQVDQGISINVAHHISPFILESEGVLVLRQEWDLKRYPFASIVTGVFGFTPGQVLPAQKGQNEFLSALAAASLLHAWTTPSVLLEITACIEATIPFRAKGADGKRPADLLFERLIALNTELSLGMSREVLKMAVRRAVRMANQDVSDFGGESATRFLKNTWELVPEINPLLRTPASYTIEGYRQALQKMERFFSGLDASSIFQKFDTEPNEKTFSVLSKNAASRVEEAQYYFRLKLISLGILEAIAGTLGKNLGLPVLMGELSNLGSPEERIDRFLSPVQRQSVSTLPIESRLLSLLEANEAEQEAVGLKSSPLTAFLLRAVGFEMLANAWSKTDRFFAGDVPPNELLGLFPLEVVGNISDAVSTLLQRRAKRISTFVGTNDGSKKN
jgi:hypothetical protein